MMKKPTTRLAVLLAALGPALGAHAKDWPAPVKASKVQIWHVMVGILGPTSLGKAAAQSPWR